MSLHERTWQQKTWVLREVPILRYIWVNQLFRHISKTQINLTSLARYSINWQRQKILTNSEANKAHWMRILLKQSIIWHRIILYCMILYIWYLCEKEEIGKIFIVSLFDNAKNVFMWKSLKVWIWYPKALLLKIMILASRFVPNTILNDPTTVVSL